MYIIAGPSAPVDSTGQPTPQRVASSPPPAYGRPDQTPNQQDVQNEVCGRIGVTVYKVSIRTEHGQYHNVIMTYTFTGNLNTIEVCCYDSLIQIQGAPMPITAYVEPPNYPPHSYLMLVVITLVICSVLNPTSLGLGVPAVVLSSLVSL